MKKIALFIVFIIAAQTSFSQWKSCNTDLFGGQVSSLYANGSTIFAGTKAGVFRSTDNGATWTITSVIRETGNSIAASGTDLYAGTTDGIYSSTDNGTTWSHFYVGAFDNVVNSIMIKDNSLYAGTTNGFFVSTDNGTTWTPKNNGIGAMPNVTAVAAHGAKLFAGTKDKGLFVSSDNGQTWSSVGSMNYRINTIVNGGSNMYAGTSNGIFVSTDEGATWNRKVNGLNEIYIYSIAANGNYVFLSANDGVYTTTDLGENWTQTSMNSEAVTALTFGGNTLFAGGNEVVNYSTDFGSNWAMGKTNPTSNFINSFIRSGENIYIASYKGVFVSTDGCETWTPKMTGLTDAFVKGLGVSGTYLVAYTTHDSVFYSTDGGDFWTATNKVMPNDFPGVQYINGVSMDQNNIYVATNSGVYISGDRGNTWTKKPVGLAVEEVSAIAIDGSTIYAAIRNHGLYRSTDNGSTWTVKNNGLTSVNINTINVKGEKIGVGTNEGIFLSTNNGDSWNQYNEGMLNPISSTLAIEGNTLISGSDQGINMSKTGGMKWFEANNGLVYHIIKGIAVNGDDIYVGTFGGGVFKAKLSEFQDIGVAEPTPIRANIRLYPNPTEHILNISTYSMTNGEARIYDMLGNLLMTAVTQGSEVQSIDVSGLSPGTYFVRIGDQTKMFVKN